MQFQDSFFEVIDNLDGISIPKKFTFPFFYQPHPIALLAVESLRQYLSTQTDFKHNFGLEENSEGLEIGKMFGILVVKNAVDEIGYLSAFSGKLAGTNQHSKFVPPVFDMLENDGFFLLEELEINKLNVEIENLENSISFQNLKTEFELLLTETVKQIENLKSDLKERKKKRDFIRSENRNLLNNEEFAFLEENLVKESLADKRSLKKLAEEISDRREAAKLLLEQFENTIAELKNLRKSKSGNLQDQLFEQYKFLNIKGEEKSLKDIFELTPYGKPPAAAGECATPKLLQYAFKNGYEPIAMAEFWWGASPKSEIRKHKQFYPACIGKCEPILKHMLEGIPLEPNPMFEGNLGDKKVEIIYEDQRILVVNKPEGLLSVPGKNISDSVFNRLKSQFPAILNIHRLDQGTSGLMVFAKDKQAHQFIQKQFIQHKVLKRYVALLDEEIVENKGEIKLPLEADFDDRPRQRVSFESGKSAITYWERVEVGEAISKIYFWPKTGRTHQLRVHSAHILGLKTPIKGDDLYGTPSDRLYLHAAEIAFMHPETKERVSFFVKEDF